MLLRLINDVYKNISDVYSEAFMGVGQGGCCTLNDTLNLQDTATSLTFT